MKDLDKKFVPVYEYANQKNTSVQNVYRWIREGKIKPEDVKREIVEVKRIKVRI